MTWYGILLITWWVANGLASIGMVGRSIRYTPGMAVGLVIIYALAIWGLVTVGTEQP